MLGLSIGLAVTPVAAVAEHADLPVVL